MEWGDLTIAKYLVRGEWIYVLWRGGQQRFTYPQRLSQHPSAAEAMRAADLLTPDPSRTQ